MNNLTLDFPILKLDGADFNDDVLYQVEAEYIDKKLTITHTLMGKSFIRQLIKNGKAKFAVSLFYKDSAERQSHKFDGAFDNGEKIIARQIIDNKFSYAPEITANIIILEDIDITVSDESGLTDFWDNGEKFTIPSYARVAYYSTLNFNDGSITKLIHIALDENHQKGTLSVHVAPTAGEGDKPVKVLCAEDVYDELNKIKQVTPDNAQDAMRYAIVTQILCAIYGDVVKIEDKEDNEIHNGLLAHLELLKNKTEEDWASEDFNPSLAATKMQPYVIESLKNTEDDNA